MTRPTCQRCGRPRRMCYCHLLVRLSNRREVVILQHPAEADHALGTAVIAARCLRHCRLLPLHERELPGADPGLARRLEQPALIYPGPDSRPLDLLREPQWRDRPLLFVDASWRKSRRLLHQSPWLAGLPRFGFQATHGSRYRIRREPRPGYCSTLEAIVRVLERVENAPARYRPLLDVMDWMVDRQIEEMGADVYRRHYAGRNPQPLYTEPVYADQGRTHQAETEQPDDEAEHDGNGGSHYDD